MKNFEQYLNESIDRLDVLRRSFLYPISPLIMTETKKRADQYKMIDHELKKLLEISDSIKPLTLRSYTPSPGSTSQRCLLFPDAFLKGGSVLKINDNWTYKSFSYEYYHGSFLKNEEHTIVQISIFKNDKSDFQREAVCVNPEIFVKTTNAEMMLAILSNDDNCSAINACFGYKWTEKFLKDRKGAVKLNKYDL